MQRLILICSLFWIIGACSSKDEAFCNCLKAGEAFNAQSERMLEDQTNPAEREKYKQLRKKKEESCRDYRTMDGPTMLKKKQACEN